MALVRVVLSSEGGQKQEQLKESPRKEGSVYGTLTVDLERSVQVAEVEECP